ncbi:NAD(P)/FAD-dependent oxidoreductase [Actinocatenispora sera]|uniref:NAD(P)/FAD-dependent oxidoreductase n=1 Tax=Actinocatenispora sera TaxID=390989 RepID=UPI0033C26DCD
MTETLQNSYDVVVIGGGAAGLNGALMLARSRRSVLVVDAGQPRNAPAAGVHGLLGREGMAPGDLLARGRDEVRSYGGQVVAGTVESAARHDAGFVVTLADGSRVRARRLLVTTGLVDELPEVPGLRERWGREVVHCPYCHGYEVRDQAIGVLATGPMSVHQALMFAQLSDDVVYFVHESPAPTGEAAERLAALHIPVLAGTVTAAEVADDRLVGLRLADGTLVRRDAIAVATRMVARAGFLGDLGLRPVPHPSGFGEHLPVDELGRAEVPGVWAAGNVTDLTAQVGAAAAAGALAGAQLNADLIEERVREAVAARADGFSAADEARVAERVLGDRRHGLAG